MIGHYIFVINIHVCCQVAEANGCLYNTTETALLMSCVSLVASLSTFMHLLLLNRGLVVPCQADLEEQLH